MSKPRKYSLPEVFNNVKLGVVFEFYSSKDINFIINDLKKLTVKEIFLTDTDSYVATYAKPILIREYIAEKPKYSFQLAQQQYSSIIPLIENVLEWISETSDCTNDTLMRINMSFDHSRLKTIYDISKMNPQKLILKIDEDFIYSRFPENEYSPYSRSAKQLSPLSSALYTDNLIKNVNYIIGVPNTNYYGINFENYTRGILEFNYIGGLDYSSKKKEILELLEYYVIITFKSLNEADYSKEELYELEKMTERFYKIQEAYYDPIQFFKLFPDIRVSIDLEINDQIIKSFWPKLRTNLFNVIINNKMDKGQFNYDSAYGIYQLRNAEIDCTSLENFDLIQCEIQGVIKNCNIMFSEINNARVYNSKIVKNNKVSDSYIYHSTIDYDNAIDGCVIENNFEVINCNILNSTLKFITLGRRAKLDKYTVIIDKEHRLPQPASGVEVEEIRDYKWIQKMNTQKEDHIFGNEYIKKTYI